MRAMLRLLPVAAVVWLALAPSPAHADCTTPELPGVGCLTPAPSPSPTMTPQPSDAVTPSPQTTQATTAAVVTVVRPVAPVAPAAPELPAGLSPLAPLGAPTAPLPAPAVAPAPAPVVPAVSSAVQTAPVAQSQVAVAPLSGVVASSFALVAFGLLAIPLLLSFLAGLRPVIVPSALPALHSGGTVNTHRTRLWIGMGVLAAAAVVGGVGWYRLSGEPLLNRQIPFLASAGILVVLLSVLGGSLIIAEQLRGDQNRIGELEDAVRALTEALSPMVEQPARRTGEVAVTAPKSRARSRRADASST